MAQIIFIVTLSALFLIYSYFFNKKGFEFEPQLRAFAWFGFVVFGVVLIGRVI